MKKFIAVIGLVALANLVQAQKFKYEPIKYTYSEGVEFSVVNSKLLASISIGNVVYMPGKGEKFIRTYLTMTNNTDNDVEIDFEEFFILDSSDRKYKIELVLQTMKVSNTMNKFNLVLKAGKTVTYVLEFSPIDKNEIINKMLVKDKVINLEISGN